MLNVPMKAHSWSHLIDEFFCLYSVTSSEKADKAQRYADFTLLSVPYPGKQLQLTFSVTPLEWDR